MCSCFNHFHLVNTWHGLLDLLRHCSNRQTERELAKEQLIWNQSILGIKDLEKTILELFIACNAAHLKSLMEDMKMTIQKDNLCRFDGKCKGIKMQIQNTHSVDAVSHPLDQTIVTPQHCCSIVPQPIHGFYMMQF